ncbi:SDR family NAD(P)-dependent oxidoreductase [Leptospira levettii]|uniref:SDR family NAD(P)-dependent oxidoreductase n=1 Tax=Leptospira levettii TaxID=2023178 RepID=A0ABY2MMP1_9LEPT|nr:SDR family NAD(P)-dependent oxidoreductase [Leptospira levettii]TGL69583.1 SDR family NAD(P)-dependent oxidoreductase [Leptospira levettii]TGM25799.1 SDR family NAD(P)-dependent oxidoreductase [Leptospira levettii]TGM66375.1 SDR family NAD(P)-dependent oxidoreductase [Leptospira levettii]TGM75430.1 SDR family NAD(P)-dependent oxidoreductase [Leptospira levettii]
MNEFYRDEWVWITGASSGIGKELVKQASAQNAKLLLASRKTKDLEQITKELGLEKGRYAIEKLDLENYKQVSIFTKRCLKKYGVPKVVIHNGGISQRSYTRETNLTTIEKIMNTNFYGAVELTRAILTEVKKPIHFAVISSVAGKMGSPLRSAYSASKFALVGFFHSLRAEEEKSGLFVTMVYPGFIQTNISKNALQGDGSSTGKMDSVIESGLPVQLCAHRILHAVANKQREVVIAGIKEKFGLFLQTIFPSLFFKMIQNVKVR